MNTDFWIQRWSNGEIGFHQREVNEYLRRYWTQLEVAESAHVFVPLCGKSLDLRWLAQRGHRVIGVEVAREAVADFFREWGVEPQVVTQGAFERWHSGSIEILCGDFFALSQGDLANVSAIFDRAALIALPPDMRKDYARKMREVLPAGASMLLVTLDYPQQEMSGPPFSVKDAEVRSLFAGAVIDALGGRDITQLPENARFRQKGVTKLVETAYRITRIGR